ncbi:MAG TPA: hypothetical protein VLW86_10985 [Syntrophorhabdales bacterium]|nr:hypothetical protein [Syntrophorhabdales bacterium]
MGRLARNQRQTIFLASILLAVMAITAAGVEAEESPTPAAGPGSFLAEHFSYDLRVLSFGVLQQPTSSTQNPSNNFLQLQRYVGDGELRPDLRLSLGNLDLSAKPRARLDYNAWEDGTRKGDSDWDHDFFVNEWLARLKLRENLFVSYGRENLQWGPSYLFSPSNPFFQDNGRRNTFLEVPGEDFGRLVWIPAASCSFSFIANTDPGLNKTTGPGAFLSSTPPPPFERTYTVKADYTGREAYASLILSRRQDAENVLGFFGGWTATDAILLYGEGAFTQGSTGLYPVEERFSPLGASMETVHKDDSAIDPTILLGASYTFESKGILSLEYAYYGPGYGEHDAETYYDLRRRAAQSLALQGPIAGLSMETLGQTAQTDLRFLRKNYAMLQYTQTNIRNDIDLTFRWTQNLDDGSGQFFALASYSLGKHVELFSAAAFMAGGKNTEFGSVLDYQVMLGLEYTF